MNELITHIIIGSIYTGVLYFFIYKNSFNYYLTSKNIPAITENSDNTNDPDDLDDQDQNNICAICLCNFKRKI